MIDMLCDLYARDKIMIIHLAFDSFNLKFFNISSYTLEIML